MSCQSLIEARGLCLQRPGQVAVGFPDFDLRAGERLFLLGANGRGKTTLLHALLGFVPLHSGSLRIFGRPHRVERDFIHLRGPLGLLFQDANDQLFGPTVAEDVAFGPLNLGHGAARSKEIAAVTLARLGITGLAGRPVHQLCGGEQRLVALAGVLAMSPKVLLLDEPTTGLDSGASEMLLGCLMETGLPMLIASHDHSFIGQFATRTLELEDIPASVGQRRV